MTREQKFILQVLSDNINGVKTEPVENLDWAVIYNYSVSHQITAIIYYQCKKFIPVEIERFFKSSYSSTLFYYTNRMSMLRQIENNVGVPYFTVKGMDVAKYYPVPSLRTMGDVDIIMHSSDRDIADEKMSEMGFNSRKMDSAMEWHYEKNGIMFELHDQLLYEKSDNDPILIDYFSDPWGHVQDNKLDWNYHILFVLAHLRKHLVYSGSGFRMFMDVAVLSKYCKEIDWNCVEKELSKINMEKFTRTVMTLNKLWFGIDSPIDEINLEAGFVQQATEQVFANGVFGYENKDNENAIAVNMLKNESKLSMLLKGIFPPYKKLVRIPYLKFLVGRPYLLPLAWVIYFIHGVFHGKVGKAIGWLGTDNSEIEKRTKMYEQWGL